MAQKQFLDYQGLKDFLGLVKTKIDTAVADKANVIEGVKVNGVALSIADKMVDVLIAQGSTNGTLSVQGVDVAVKGLAALAYKANVSAEDLNTALKDVIDAKAESSDVTTLSGKIDVLNGTGTGSISKAINDAFDDFATKVSDDGVVNSYKELIDWAAAHGGDAAKMAASITKLEGLMNGIGGEGQPTNVMTAISSAIADLNLGNYYNKTEVDKVVDDKVKAIDLTPFETSEHASQTYQPKGDYVVANDLVALTKTDIQTIVNEVYGTSAE